MVHQARLKQDSAEKVLIEANNKVNYKKMHMFYSSFLMWAMHSSYSAACTCVYV